MIRLTYEPTAPGLAELLRARLRAAATMARDAGRTIAATSAAALADDLAATQYELALACEASGAQLSDPRAGDMAIDRAITEAAGSVERPGELRYGALARADPDVLLCALAAAGLLDEVLQALHLAVAESHGAVVVLAHGRAIAALPADTWRQRLAAARRAPESRNVDGDNAVACPSCSGNGCSPASRASAPEVTCDGSGRVAAARAAGIRGILQGRRSDGR